ncbi:MAG: hypothetical protein ABIB65_00225 [Candidatus Margulisiibacteriota bacterium]
MKKIIYAAAALAAWYGAVRLGQWMAPKYRKTPHIECTHDRVFNPPQQNMVKEIPSPVKSADTSVSARIKYLKAKAFDPASGFWVLLPMVEFTEVQFEAAGLDKKELFRAIESDLSGATISSLTDLNTLIKSEQLAGIFKRKTRVKKPPKFFEGANAWDETVKKMAQNRKYLELLYPALTPGLQPLGFIQSPSQNRQIVTEGVGYGGLPLVVDATSEDQEKFDALMRGLEKSKNRHGLYGWRTYLNGGHKSPSHYGICKGTNKKRKIK